jgi:hypothetical protein
MVKILSNYDQQQDHLEPTFNVALDELGEFKIKTESKNRKQTMS